MDLREYIQEMAKGAKQGSRALAKATSVTKNKALQTMASLLKERISFLIEENKKDIADAQEKGLSTAMLDRLTLNEKRIIEMADGIMEIANLHDPVGEILYMRKRPNGMSVGKMRVPIGVICIIYESRPNVTADATALCLKAGNAVILRGGSEAFHSNKAIVDILKEAVASESLPKSIISFVEYKDRAAIYELVQAEGLIDVVIPRGGEGLIRTVTEHSRIPVLKHYKGVCHVYVDRDCDLKMAEEVCFNAKVQRPGTCNAMETMLVDAAIAKEFLPVMLERFAKAGVTLKGCTKTREFYNDVNPYSEEDLYNEYLDLILNVKIVKDMDEAIEHINKYGSAHTDSIVTTNNQKGLRFLLEVDSSAVMVNASTRLNDGGQFGLGAEIGISTDKIHARGPMGIEELTSTKFIVFGDGQLRQ
ncbi:MAG: glutamate-5-semialdehyde dehydrogenase [Candidatus Magnetoovum sp. WYHC-5]|nr:glutamate-5-semialdehyde dehydrogenase [Candidatus Magnetoovum sp. WYHC-5]